MSRLFPIEDILTVTTGYFMCSDIGKVYEILNYMTGDNLYTHQLPRAGRACAPVLIEQLPLLAQVDITNDMTLEQKYAVVEEARKKIGEALWVTPLREWAHIGPIRELTEMVGEDRVIVVDTNHE